MTRIIDDRPVVDEIVAFNELSVGSYFVGPVSGDLYVKISNSLTEKNAFNLSVDRLATFGASNKFHSVIAEIHIIKDLQVKDNK